MKKTSITITWEEDKLSALRLYLAEKEGRLSYEVQHLKK